MVRPKTCLTSPTLLEMGIFHQLCSGGGDTIILLRAGGDKLMRQLSTLLLSTLYLVCIAQAQGRPEPVRLCVSTLENSSRHIVSPTWQRNQLINAFERINKSKDVKKGKVPKIETVALDSPGEPDSTVREKNCVFVLSTNLTEVFRPDRPSVSLPPPGAIQVGTEIGDSRAYPSDYHTATVNYALMRAGNLKPWASGVVTAEDRLPEETLVSQLMDQIANRVASELRKPRPSVPQ